jgi:hypothetical protein
MCDQVMNKWQRVAFRVGQFNLLCPTYGVKWGEREACCDWISKTDHGVSNWDRRWPALLRILKLGAPDVLALEELEESTREAIQSGMASLGMTLLWFPHPAREDALGIAFNPQTFALQSPPSHLHFPPEDPKATIGRVSLCHNDSGVLVNCLVTHQRGGNPAQMAGLVSFAQESSSPNNAVTLVCGDFNEDFGLRSPLPGFRTLHRTEDEPLVSRPAHKQDPAQKSGKGKIGTQLCTS